MKYFIICVLILLSCGKNLADEDGDFRGKRPSNLVYSPDTLTYIPSTQFSITSATPTFTQGSGSNARFTITYPINNSIKINELTGVVTVYNNIGGSQLYNLDIKIENIAGSTTFTNALIIDVK